MFWLLSGRSNKAFCCNIKECGYILERLERMLQKLKIPTSIETALSVVKVALFSINDY